MPEAICPVCRFDENEDATCQWHPRHEQNGIDCMKLQLANKDALIRELVEAAEFFLKEREPFFYANEGRVTCRFCGAGYGQDSKITHLDTCEFKNNVTRIREAKEATNDTH